MARRVSMLPLVASLAFLAFGQPALAGVLAQPTGPVLLTVTGPVTEYNGNHAAAFNLDMLKALPATTFTTSTIWTDGPQTFTGVSLKVLLDQLGIKSGLISAVAINDYAVTIPVSDAVEGGPIIAYEANGKPMPVREKGPLWIVYPYDHKDAYRSEVIYSRSIWQLAKIAAKP